MYIEHRIIIEQEVMYQLLREEITCLVNIFENYFMCSKIRRIRRIGLIPFFFFLKNTKFKKQEQFLKNIKIMLCDFKNRSQEQF